MSVEEPSRSRTISVEVNGDVYEREVDARRLLVHFIRDDIDLTGTTLNYPSSCATELESFRDAVLTLIVPEGGPYDVDVTAKLDVGRLALGSSSSKNANRTACVYIVRGVASATTALRTFCGPSGCP